MRTLLLALLVACGDAEEATTPTPTPEPAPAAEPEAAKARVFFVEPKDGETLTSPVRIVMGLEGMEVRKAGEMAENTGHHHVIIDGTHIEKGEVVPSDEKHVHFGQGQTEASIELQPGEYTLRLQFADGEHRSYGQEMSDAITVKVVETPR